MKYKSYIIIFYALAAAIGLMQQDVIPDGFVEVKTIIPDLDVELRYYTTNNFVGDTIDGYRANVLYLTEAASKQLKLVQEELQLKIYV